MSNTMFHVPYVKPEEVRGTKLARAFEFSRFCKNIIVSKLESQSEWDAKTLYSAVRDDVEVEYGRGSYVWEIFESHLDDLVDDDKVEIFDGDVWGRSARHEPGPRN